MQADNRLYEKLAKDIVYSSVWGHNSDVCKVWVTMIALKGRDHVVTAPVSGIARLIGMSMETIERCLDVLQQPDPESQSKAHDGRRLIRVENGLLVVNGDKYREMGWSEEKRTWERRRKQEQREKRANEPDDVDDAEDKPPARVSPHLESARSIIQKMNSLSGASLRPVDRSVSMIAARLSEPDVTVEGVLKMVERVWNRWKTETSSGGTPMTEYFRIKTLFAPTNFNEYYASKDLPVTKSEPNNPNKPRQSELIMSVNAIKKTVW